MAFYERQAKDLSRGEWLYLAGDFRFVESVHPADSGWVFLKLFEVPLLRVREGQWFRLRREP